MGRVAVETQAPRARTGGIELTMRCDGGRTRLASLVQHQPMRALFPIPVDLDTAVLVNTGGGLVAGDRLATVVRLGEGARLVATTQAAEKVYRSQGEDVAVATRLEVADGAHLEWLPQETILFERARLDRSLDVRLGAEATLLAVEIVVFGRRARGETFLEGSLRDRWDLRVDGRLAWAERFRLDPATSRDAFASVAALDQAAAMATLVARPRRAELETARAALDGLTVTVSRLGDLLIGRVLGPDAARVRHDAATAAARWRESLFGLPGRLPSVWAF